jgi:hypothetical protein
LQRQSAWTQIAQSGNLALDALDAFLKKLGAVGHGAIILNHPQKNIYRYTQAIDPGGKEDIQQKTKPNVIGIWTSYVR